MLNYCYCHKLGWMTVHTLMLMYIRCFNIQAFFHIMVYLLKFFLIFLISRILNSGPLGEGGGGGVKGPRAEKMPRAPRKTNPALISPYFRDFFRFCIKSLLCTVYIHLFPSESTSFLLLTVAGQQLF